MAANAQAAQELIDLDAEPITTSRHRAVTWPLVVGLGIFAVIALLCIFAPLITHYDPTAQDLLHPGAPPFTGGHVLGTDAPYGRDVLSRLLYGGRADLAIGLGGTGVTIVVGTLIGLISGYYGGWVDSVLMRIADVFFAFPFLVLVLAIVAALGPSLFNLFVAIWAVGWVSYARIIRGQTLSMKQRDFVLASRCGGCKNGRIMVRHILPHIISAALVFAMVDAIGNILLAAALGYLGLGVQEPAPEWGTMIADGQQYIVTQWWVPTIPGIAIAITGISFSLIGDGLATYLRPRG
ncbi:MAG TPA: ABC transporter permease [Chloroflexota bacterium]|nr:ABC transporter permease [Chloroflexota bacterium]